MLYEVITSQYGASKAYDTYEALANDPQIDAAYIATPHSLHKDNTVMCLKKGIAVLCEKPFAMNLDEVQEIVITSYSIHYTKLYDQSQFSHFFIAESFFIDGDVCSALGQKKQ